MINFFDRIPGHTAVTIENYLLYGYEPGGFVTAMLTQDLYRACMIADQVNSEYFTEIGKWIYSAMPAASFGSVENMRDWIADKNGMRTKYREDLEKTTAWKILKGEHAWD
jgi:hypothetical protein